MEQEKTQKEEALEGVSERNYTKEGLEITAVLRKVRQERFDYDTLLFHGSTIVVDNRAYLSRRRAARANPPTPGWCEISGSIK